MNSLSRYQDVFGQLAFLKTYTQLCVGFRIADASVAEATLTTAIQQAAAKLTDAFPWLAGQVIVEVEANDPSHSRPFKIVPYEKHTVNPPVLVTKLPNIDYDEIVKKRAPFSMLDGNILAPRKGIPSGYDKEEEPAPVFIIQANFVKNGLLLTFAAQHNAMDMNGQGHLITLFAKALKGESFTQTELAEGNRDRRNLIPLLGLDEPLRDLGMFIVNGETPHPQPHPATWVYFRFSRTKLDELKAKALASITNTNASLRPSTNDVLTAFIWKSVSTARVARLSPTDRTHPIPRLQCPTHFEPSPLTHLHGSLRRSHFRPHAHQPSHQFQPRRHRTLPPPKPQCRRRLLCTQPRDADLAYGRQG
jgi:hypothetical protein